MTPPLALVDPQLERMFVAALIADPDSHDLITELGVCDLEDFRASAAYGAIANLREAGTTPTVATIAARLLAEWIGKNPDEPEWIRADQGRTITGWLEILAATAFPAKPPIAMWAAQLLVLAETRRGAIAAETPPPARKPRGPRAENIEPTRLAEAFRRYRYEQDGEPTLVRWARAWWRYDGTRYVEHDDEALDRDIIGFLDTAVAPVTVVDKLSGIARAELRRVTSKNKTIGEVRKAALHAFPIVGSGAPQWTSALPDDPPAARLVPCANGILDLGTLDLLPATPRLFATASLGTHWDPAAEAPTWLAFLQSLWGDDSESVQALQQLFGYLLTPDTGQQKMFMLQGPPRSGKGTIARVLRALLSPGAVAHPTLESLEGPFGLAPLVGKTAAIIGDARLGNAQEQSAIVERLLSISGEDALSINRKNRDAIDVRLTARVLLLTNELPRLYDTSGAIVSRFVILCLPKSFLGNEDTGLTARLLAELPGIFRWAVEGYQDLQERGRFISPLSSEAAIGHMQALASPLSVFVEDCCIIDVSREIEIDALYQRYLEWCKANGTDRPGNKQWFGRNLNTLHPEIEQARPQLPTGKRVRTYRGVGLQ
jgi:putative DNA primase/helicase